MTRLLLLLILVVIVGRAFWRLVDGVVEGVTAPRQPQARAPQHSLRMVRDPVCGTFVLPERAITLANGSDQLYFCSAGCRDRYQARHARPA
jgi:hypothetical protein